MTNFELARTAVNRRTFLQRGSGVALGSIALGALLNPKLLRADAKSTPAATPPGATGVVHPLHHKPKIKRVIWLYMAGGPSHLETLDYKPKLAEMHGQPMPESFTKGQPIAQLQGAKLNCFGPQHPFQKYGKSGQQICSIFPNIGAIAVDIGALALDFVILAALVRGFFGR